MMKSIAALALLSACYMAPAHAQNCAPRDQVVSGLTEKYGEHLVMLLASGNTSIYEVFVNEETSTWTIAQTRPSGLTCLMTAGDAVETFEAVEPSEGT
jgi:hypothetical protein